MGRRIGAGASACPQFGNGEHFLSHSQRTQGFLAQKKNVCCKWCHQGWFPAALERGVAAGEMPEPFTGFQTTLRNLM